MHALSRRTSLVASLTAAVAFTTVAQTWGQEFVPTRAQRGIYAFVAMEPEFESTTDSIVDGFGPYENRDDGSFGSLFGSYAWSTEHLSTLGSARLSSWGSVFSNVEFETDSTTASAFIVSVGDIDFTLTQPATVRFRGMVDLSAGPANPYTGRMRGTLFVWLGGGMGPELFEFDSWTDDSNIAFDQEFELPAGTYNFAINSQIDGRDYYAAAGYWANLRYRAVLAIVDCPADLNRDGVVDVEDLADVLARFGTRGDWSETADLDLDGDVDLQDLAEMLGSFGTTCPQ